MRHVRSRAFDSAPALGLLFALGALSAFTVPACGSRTGLVGGGAGAGAVQSCRTADDCIVPNPCVVMACIDTYCQEAGEVECPSIDPCTKGTCEPDIGECVYEPVTEDLDGDGFLGPLPGAIAGQPGSCGDDCDDTRALAFPGGEEVCDGVDNDCDGIVDNGSDYLSTVTIERDLKRLQSGALASSGSTDLVFGAGTFVASYWGRTDTQRAYIHGIDERGEDTFAERLAANLNSTTFGADLAFSGVSFGALLSDNRLGNYEVSFAHFDVFGNKLGPDVWITDAPGMSTHERLIFDQGRFVAVWDDHREGTPRVYAQFIDSSGALVGENMPLSELGQRAELPIIAATPARFGIVHTVLLSATEAGTQLRTFDKNFGDATSQALDIPDMRVPNITAIGSNFLVTWNAYDFLANRPGPSVRGALYDERGALLVPARDLTSGAMFAHSHAVLSLGDRALLVWADDADGNYEIYAKVIGLDLADIEPRTRLTAAAYDSINPFLAVTETGSVGILFDDKRTTVKEVYFMTLGCESSPACDCSGCSIGVCPSCCIVK